MAPAIMAAAVSGSSWSSSWLWFYSADFESLPPIHPCAANRNMCESGVFSEKEIDGWIQPLWKKDKRAVESAGPNGIESAGCR